MRSYKLRSYKICVTCICLIRRGIEQIRIFSNLKINIDCLHYDKIEFFLVICIREKYGVVEFRFFSSWIGKFIFDIFGLSNGTGWTILYLYFESCEIFQVRSHDEFWVLNYESQFMRHATYRIWLYFEDEPDPYTFSINIVKNHSEDCIRCESDFIYLSKNESHRSRIKL